MAVSVWVDILLLAAVPATLLSCALLNVEASALLTLLVACGALALMALRLERSGPRLRQLMPVVTLGGLAAAGRVLFAPLPDIKPVSAICIVSGAMLGPRAGFATGALAALVSNFFFGQGPWTPWQMYAWGLVGYLAGVLAGRGLLGQRWVRLGFGFVSALLYGLILNSWYVVGFVHPLTLPAALAAFGAGLPWDILHGVATVAFLTAIWEPWARKIRRVVLKYGLDERRERAGEDSGGLPQGGGSA